MYAIRSYYGKGELKNMERKGERIHLEFHIPSRGLIGMTNNMLTSYNFV